MTNTNIWRAVDEPNITEHSVSRMLLEARAYSLRMPWGKRFRKFHLQLDIVWQISAKNIETTEKSRKNWWGVMFRRLAQNWTCTFSVIFRIEYLIRFIQIRKNRLGINRKFTCSNIGEPYHQIRLHDSTILRQKSINSTNRVRGYFLLKWYFFSPQNVSTICGKVRLR